MRFEKVLGLTVLGLFLACGSDSRSSDDDDDGGGAGGSGGAGVGAGAGAPEVGAAGVTVNSVAFYQSVERVLSLDGVAQASNVPIVAGRDGMLRVFHTTSPDSVGKTVTARLTVEGQAPVSQQVVLSAASAQGDLGSTLNIDVPGNLVDAAFNYRVDIVEAGSGTDNPGAHYPAEGFEPHAVDVQANIFRVVLVPFQYNADGSGRLPDTSPASVEAYRQRYSQLFPVSSVEVTVREPIAWNTQITPFGQGWQEAMEAVYSLRLSDGVPMDVYYYGIFNPQPSIADFCGGGCLLGVTALNDQPTDFGSPELRWAVGVGYTETTYDTSSHELGHAHGREHVNCGQGIDPQSIDTSYPHNPSSIGSWGYDIFGQQLINPSSHTDIMGYCNSQWISDYNYAALAARGKNVNQPDWHGPADTRMRAVAFDANGVGTFLPLTHSTPHSLGSLDVNVSTKGKKQVVQGKFYPYDHMAGGWLMYPERTSAPMDRVEVVVDGKTLVAKR